MKINHRPIPEEGDTRIGKGFLWFPKRIGNQTRWLEFAIWEEEYVWTMDTDGLGASHYWVGASWIDKGYEDD